MSHHPSCRSMRTWRASALPALLVLFGGATAHAQSIKADHTTLDVDLIPLSALNTARAVTMTLEHASVGSNIEDGMDDLESSDATRYAYPNWDWVARGNPGWQAKVDGFTDCLADHENEYEVFQMKFCYIDDQASWTYYRDAYLALESSYPAETIVWWTMPIRTSGHADRDAFNTAVRDYCSTNDKPLYDIADIESHDPAGNPITEGGYEAMYQSYSDDGGHLNDVGRLRAAKGMWYLMARIAGWSGSGGGGGGGATGGGGVGASGGAGGATGGSGVGGTASGGATTGGSGGSGASGASGGSGGSAIGGSIPAPMPADDDSDCECGLTGAPVRPPLVPLGLLTGLALAGLRRRPRRR